MLKYCFQPRPPIVSTHPTSPPPQTAAMTEPGTLLRSSTSAIILVSAMLVKKGQRDSGAGESRRGPVSAVGTLLGPAFSRGQGSGGGALPDVGVASDLRCEGGGTTNVKAGPTPPSASVHVARVRAMPRTSERARFQPATATGKLKAVIMPTTPSGFHVSIRKWSGPGRRGGREGVGGGGG